MQKRSFVYLINPISGTANKRKLVDTIVSKSKGIHYTIEHTQKNGDYSLLRKKILQEKITDLIVCGGDGTISAAAASMFGVDVNFGIVPMGSGNGLALGAGISSQPEKALDIILAGKSDWVDGFFVNDKFGCMLTGIGFDAKVAADFNRDTRRGLATYVKQIIRNFIKADAYPFHISLNGEEIPTEAFFISIANSNQFGNHVTIAPQASLSDGLLDVVIAENMSKPRLLYNLLTQVRSGEVDAKMKHINESRVQYFQTKELKIQNPQMAPLHIDGDIATTDETIHIRVKEKAFRLLQPGKENDEF